MTNSLALFEHPDASSSSARPSNSAPWMPEAIETIAIVALVLGIHAQTRKHSRRQIKMLMHAIEKYGFPIPILIDQGNAVIAGEARVIAARQLGLSMLPAIKLKHLTDAQIRAFRIADNRLCELGSWDKDVLAREILELRELHIDPLDLGFSVTEVDLLVEHHTTRPTAEINDCPATDRAKPAIAQPGDIWRCGSHRVACGDTRDSGIIQSLIGTGAIRMVCTDPPYNVPISGNVSGLGKIKHEDFLMGCGEMSDDAFVEFLADSLRASMPSLVPGALLYVFMDDAHLEHVFAATRVLGLEKIDLCVWAKTNGGMGSFYRSQTEFVVVLRVPGAAHLNNIQLGRFGRNRTTLWKYEGANSINPDRRKELGLHPTVKNAQMIADAIMDCTNAGDTVFDGFLGSGTTLIAAEDTRRVCYGVEYDAHYVDVILRRYREFTCDEPVHAASGRTLAACEADMSDATPPDNMQATVL